MTEYQLKMPKQIYAGEHAIDKVTEILKHHQSKKVVLFTDKGILGVGLAELVTKQLEALEVPYTILSDIPAEPSYQQAQAIIDEFKAEKADFVIALGGGSVMDVTKLATVLMTDDYTVKDLLDNPLLAKKQVTSLMIPTTAGTGAEATPNSIVLVPEKDLKVGIVNPDMIGDYVILESEMIRNLPKPIAAATGVDALCHAIECYTSNKANLISDTFALEALDLIMNNIEEAVLNRDNLVAKEKMLLGSFYAGVAITSSGTTAVHALSYPLGGKYHIAHGVSNAILLVPVMNFNLPAIKDLLAKAYDRVNAGHGELTTVDEKADWMVNRLEAIVKTLEIPTSLESFNVSKDDLESLVEAGMQVQRLLVNNKREVTPEDARNIYLEVL